MFIGEMCKSRTETLSFRPIRARFAQDDVAGSNRRIRFDVW